MAIAVSPVNTGMTRHVAKEATASVTGAVNVRNSPVNVSALYMSRPAFATSETTIWKIYDFSGQSTFSASEKCRIAFMQDETVGAAQAVVVHLNPPIYFANGLTWACPTSLEGVKDQVDGDALPTTTTATDTVSVAAICDV